MKKITAFLFATILLTVTVFAQDSTAAGGSAGFSLPAWVTTAGAIVLGIYEVFARYIPTTKNISVLGFIISLIQKVLPNKAGEGKNHA